MFATDWLSEIQTTTLIISVAAICASIPFNVTQDIHGKALKAKPLRFQRTGWTFLALVIFGWLLAKIAAHIHNPTIDVDMTGVSQPILEIGLFLTGILTVMRAFGQNNLLSQLCILLIRGLPYIAVPLGIIFSVISLGLINALDSKSSTPLEEPGLDRACTDSEKLMLKGGVNHKGDYCDKYKGNW